MKSGYVEKAFVNEQNVCSIVCRGGVILSDAYLSKIRKNFKNIFNNLDLFYEVYNSYFDTEMFKYIEVSYCIKNAKAPDIDFKVYYPEKGHENQSQAIVSAEENSENQFDESNEYNESNELRGNNMAYIAILIDDNGRKCWNVYNTDDPAKAGDNNYIGKLANEEGTLTEPIWFVSEFKLMRNFSDIKGSKYYLAEYNEEKVGSIQFPIKECAIYMNIGTSLLNASLQKVEFDGKVKVVSIERLYDKDGQNSSLEEEVKVKNADEPKQIEEDVKAEEPKKAEESAPIGPLGSNTTKFEELEWKSFDSWVTRLAADLRHYSVLFSRLVKNSNTDSVKFGVESLKDDEINNRYNPTYVIGYFEYLWDKMVNFCDGELKDSKEVDEFKGIIKSKSWEEYGWQNREFSVNSEDENPKLNENHEVMQAFKGWLKIIGETLINLQNRAEKKNIEGNEELKKILKNITSKMWKTYSKVIGKYNNFVDRQNKMVDDKSYDKLSELIKSYNDRKAQEIETRIVHPIFENNVSEGSTESKPSDILKNFLTNKATKCKVGSFSENEYGKLKAIRNDAERVEGAGTLCRCLSDFYQKLNSGGKDLVGYNLNLHTEAIRDCYVSSEKVKQLKEKFTELLNFLDVAVDTLNKVCENMQKVFKKNKSIIGKDREFSFGKDEKNCWHVYQNENGVEKKIGSIAEVYFINASQDVNANQNKDSEINVYLRDLNGKVTFYNKAFTYSKLSSCLGGVGGYLSFNMDFTPKEIKCYYTDENGVENSITFNDHGLATEINYQGKIKKVNNSDIFNQLENAIKTEEGEKQPTSTSPQGNLDINNIEKNEVENNIPADCIAILTNDNVWCAYDTEDPDNVSAGNYMGTLASERGNIPDFPKWIKDSSSFKGLRIVDRDKCYLNVYDKSQKGKQDGLKNRPRRCALYVYLGTSESYSLKRIKIDEKDFIISIVDVYTGENAPIETISSKKQKEKEKDLARKLGFNAIFQKYSYWSVLDVDSHKEIGTIQCVYGTANFFSNYEELNKKLYSGEAYLQFKDRQVHDSIACYCPHDYDDKFRDNIVVKFDKYGIAEGSRMSKDIRKKVIEINTTPLKPAKPVSKEYETPAEEVAPTEKTNKVSSSDESRVFELLEKIRSKDAPKDLDDYDNIPVEESEWEKKKSPEEMEKELEEKEKEFKALLSRYNKFADKHNDFICKANAFAEDKNVDIRQGNLYIDKINKKVLGDSYYKSRWDNEASKVEKSNFLKSGEENQDLNHKTETLKSGIVNFIRDVIMFLPDNKWNEYTKELGSKEKAFFRWDLQGRITYLDEFNALLGRAIRTLENLQNRLDKEYKQSQKGILSRVSKKLGLSKVKKRLKAVVKRKMEKSETHFPMTPPTIDTSKAKQSTKDKQEFSDKKFNSKKLQKCFKDAAIYILGKTDNGPGKFSHAEFLKKFNSVKSMSGYEAWYNSVNTAINASNLYKLNKLDSVRSTAMGVLLISLSKLLRAKDVISACNGLKDGGFKENAKLKNKDDAMFVWCVSEVRKDIKNKCTGSKETGEKLYDFIRQTKELKNLVKTEAIGNSSPKFSPPNFPAPKPPRPSAENSLPKSPSASSIIPRAARPRMPAPGEETVSVRPHLSTSQPVSTLQPRGGAAASTPRKYTRKDCLPPPPPPLPKGRPLPTPKPRQATSTPGTPRPLPKPNLTSTRRPRPLSSNSVKNIIGNSEKKS